jgi:Nitrile hydratase, alpha chain
VVPERPAGTDGMSEADLAKLVTAEGMMGVARVWARRTALPLVTNVQERQRCSRDSSTSQSPA